MNTLNNGEDAKELLNMLNKVAQVKQKTFTASYRQELDQEVNKFLAEEDIFDIQDVRFTADNDELLEVIVYVTTKDSEKGED